MGIYFDRYWWSWLSCIGCVDFGSVIMCSRVCYVYMLVGLVLAGVFFGVYVVFVL